VEDFINILNQQIMEVYEVISTNLDVNDGYFINKLFSNKKAAVEYAKKDTIDKDGKNIVEDLEGTLEVYSSKDLKYQPSDKKPAIYYRSHYGNFRCVVFIKTRTVEQ